MIKIFHGIYQLDCFITMLLNKIATLYKKIET